MRGSEGAPLEARPNSHWGRSEWAAFVGLGVALMIFGVMAFFLARGEGESKVAVVVPEVTESPTFTPFQTAELEMISTGPAMFTVTPILFEPSVTTTEQAVPTLTSLPVPSDTPPPTSTPTALPSSTATPYPPTSTPTETETPTVTPTTTPTPTPTMSFVAPQLLSPEAGQYFSGSETRIELRWSAVGSLATDEWYGLILRYRHEGNDIETGSWLKETSWVVPSYLAGQADEPDRRYDWGVVVVKEIGFRVDGTREGRESSPRSEMRSFVWR